MDGGVAAGNWLRRCVGMLCLVAGGHRSWAQQAVRGVVREGGTSVPLPGVVVEALDRDGAAVARTIADANGRFSLAPPASVVRLRAIRIGYRPLDVALPSSSNPLELVMERIPRLLNAVRVSDHELCPGSTDRGSAFQLWEQARAGLLAAIVAREAKPAVATTAVFQRNMLASDNLISWQHVDRHTGQTTRPFVAFAAPARFALEGYLREVDNERLFMAPDADVLLDESFAATHCFHLQAADAAHPDQVGLAFVPIPTHPDSLVDVSGTIWIDRTNPTLRSFDFRYTNLEPAAVRAGAGGHLEFVTGSNGVSFIPRWTLWLPILSPLLQPADRSPDPFPRPRRRQDRRDFRVEEIREAGGYVLQATWSDGTTWRDSASAITGRVVQRGSSRPLAQVLVTLAGTADTVMTDEHGAFALTNMIPGRYSVVVADTALSAFTPPRSEARVITVSRGQVVDLRMQLPSVFDAIAQACRGQKVLPNTTTIAGQVLLPSGAPAEGGVVRAVWQADYSGILGQSATINSADRTITLDAQGRFLICGVTPERPIHLTLTHATGRADTTVKSYDTLLKSVEWRVTPRPPER
jgi:hypothetical protein